MRFRDVVKGLLNAVGRSEYWLSGCTGIDGSLLWRVLQWPPERTLQEYQALSIATALALEATQMATANELLVFVGSDLDYDGRRPEEEELPQLTFGETLGARMDFREVDYEWLGAITSLGRARIAWIVEGGDHTQVHVQRIALALTMDQHQLPVANLVLASGGFAIMPPPANWNPLAA